MADFTLPSVGSVLPAILTGLGAGMEFAGNNQAAANSRTVAARQAAALQFKQQQEIVNAGQVVAAGQMSAAEQRRQGRLIQSRAQALAAASGGGAVDPTVVNIIGNNAGEIALRASIALYQGEEKARMLRMQAAADGYNASMVLEAGENKAQAYEMAGKSAIFKAAGSLYTKYGFGQPKPGVESPGEWTSGYDVPSQESSGYGGSRGQDY